MADQSLAKNFNFDLISEFSGYVSSVDKTKVAAGVMVRGSQNIFKQLSGTLAVREGQKLFVPVNGAISPISSEFVWNTSWGTTLTIIVSENKLQVLYGGQFYTLLDGLTRTRWVFDKWWKTTEFKDRLLGVNGDSNIYHWSGGIVPVASSTLNGGVSLAGNNALLTEFGVIGGTAPFIPYQNGSFSTAQFSSIVFSANPTDGQTLVLTINNTAITFHFVAVIGAVAGNVLIGVDLPTTLTNLVGLLTAPGTSNATQVALSGPNQTLVGYLTSAVTSTITETASPSWIQTGFSSTSGEMTININGVTYTYTGGEDTQTLTGITPDPSGIAPGTIAIQSVLIAINTPASNYNNDFIKVIQNRLWVGSYTSRLIYISSNTDFTNYVIPTPLIPGSPNSYVLDSNANGITAKTGNAFVSYGTSEWVQFTFPTSVDGAGVLVETLTASPFPVAKQCAALAHEFIANSGDNIIYLSQDQQVRELGNFNLLFVTGYPSLSQEIATELSEEDFTAGALKCIGDFTYVTAPKSGKTYLYQVRQSVSGKDVGSLQSGSNSLITERLWHSPMIWNVTRVDEIDGVVYGFSNANPQIYQLFGTNQWHDDSPSGEFLPYNCVLALGYRNLGQLKGGSRDKLLKFNANYSEGYITAGTILNLTINYEFDGSKNVLVAPVNSIERPAYLFGENVVGSLGDISLGDSPLGDDIIDPANQDDLPKFRVINQFSIINCFEYQPVYQSNSKDARWELLATGVNIKVAESEPSFIINKQQ